MDAEGPLDLSTYFSKLGDDRVLLKYDSVRLIGLKELVHLKISMPTSSEIRIQAYELRKEDKYEMSLTDPEKVRHVIHLCEQDTPLPFIQSLFVLV
jgi:hypothetical protein